MDKEEKLFNEIVEKMASENKNVEAGKMMSSPGIKYKNKVFAFYYDKQMGFKLGKEFNPDEFKLKDYKFLSPFKNKPPMKAWFVIPYSENKKWKVLAEEALKVISKEVDMM